MLAYDPAEIGDILDDFKGRIEEDLAGLVAHNDRFTPSHENDLKTRYAEEIAAELARRVPKEAIVADLARHMSWDMGTQLVRSSRDRGTKRVRRYFGPTLAGQEAVQFDPAKASYFAGNDALYSVYPDDAPRYDLPMRCVPIRMAAEDVFAWAKERADEAGLLMHSVQVVRSMDFPPNTVFGDPIAEEIHAELLRRA